jgi:hypothetical protein
MAPSFSGGFDCAIAVVAAIADASNASAILFIATSHAASLLRGVFIVNAIMPQPTRSGKQQVFRKAE